MTLFILLEKVNELCTSLSDHTSKIIKGCGFVETRPTKYKKSKKNKHKRNERKHEKKYFETFPYLLWYFLLGGVESTQMVFCSKKHSASCQYVLRTEIVTCNNLCQLNESSGMSVCHSTQAVFANETPVSEIRFRRVHSKIFKKRIRDLSVGLKISTVIARNYYMFKLTVQRLKWLWRVLFSSSELALVRSRWSWPNT